MKINNEYPTWVCDECGTKARNLELESRDYVKGEKAAIKMEVSTYHEAKCEICEKIKNVTEPRDFFYPNIKFFNKLKKLK